MIEQREAVIVTLIEKWHARVCDCPMNSCPHRIDARIRAETVLTEMARALETFGP